MNIKKIFWKISLIIIAVSILFAPGVLAESGESVAPVPQFTLESSESGVTQMVTYDMITDNDRIYFQVSTDGVYNMGNMTGGTDFSYLNVYRANDNVSVDGALLSNGAVSADAKNLKAGEIYYLQLTPAQIEIIMRSAGLNISATNLGTNTGTIVVEQEEGREEKKETFEKIEAIFAEAAMLLAKALNWMISMALGRTLTIDNIVFNEYDMVKLNFFTSGIGSFSGTATTPTLVDDLRNAVNSVYSIFQGIALAGYLIILVYIGIKMMLSSTAAGKKAGYKETFMCWITGIMVLFFMPYYMKYAILLNEAFVIQIGSSRSQESIIGSRNTAELDLSGGMMGTDFEDGAIDFSTGMDYMSRIGALAESTEKLGIAVAYLILSWQLVMLIVYYYKRAFITAFLIIIFPLIAFTFVWDKLNDGKSQALSAWMQEFTVGVFVQAFHAIIFVFVTNTIYATISNDNVDFILLMIAASFMFTGEEILKQIFSGGGSVAHGSVAQTAGKLMLATTAVTKIGGSLVRNTVGKDGLVRKTWAGTQEIRKNNLLLKKDENGVRNFDKLARNERSERAVAAMLPVSNSDGTPIDPDIKHTAEVVDTLNNMDKKSPEEIAKALREYKALKAARKNMDPEQAKQFDEIMKHRKFTDAQMDRLDKGIIIAATMAANNEDPVKIRQKLRMEVEIAMGGDPNNIQIKDDFIRGRRIVKGEAKKDKDGNTKTRKDGSYKLDGSTVKNLGKYDPEVRGGKAGQNDRIYQALLINMRDYTMSSGATRGITRENVNNTWDNKVKQTSSAYKKIKFATTNNTSMDSVGAKEQTRQKRENRRQGIVDQYTRASGVPQENMSSKQQAAVNACAKSIVVLEQLNTGEVSAYEAYKAVQNLEKNDELSRTMLKLSNVETDIESLRYMLAKKIHTENPGRDGRQFRVTAQQNYEEARAWAQSTVTSMEAQAAQITASEGDVYAVDRVSPNVPNNLSEDTQKREFNRTGPNRKVHFDPTAAMYGGMNYSAMGSYADTGSYRSNTPAVDVVNSKSGPELQRRHTPDDPVVSIMNIIAAAQRNSTNGTIANFEAIENATSDSVGASGIIDSKFEIIRSENQKEIVSARDFADETLKKEKYEVGAFRQAFREAVNGKMEEYEQPTYNGQTLEDIIHRRDNAVKDVATGLASMGAGLTVTTAATAISTAGAMAFTQDGMPIEEVFTGTVAGFTFGDRVATDWLPKHTGAEERMKQESEIKKKVDKRLKAEAKAREKDKEKAQKDMEEKLRARQAFADAEDATSGQADQKLAINMLAASLYTSSDDRLYARVYINADNAEYVSVDEQQAAGFSWQPYQEEITYEFRENDPSKRRDLFIYVKDRSGNLRSGRIVDVRR